MCIRDSCEIAIAIIQIDLSRVQFTIQHIKFSQISFTKIPFKNHLRIVIQYMQSSTDIVFGLQVILFVIKMVPSIIEISPFLIRIHLLIIIPCQFIVIIGKMCIRDRFNIASPKQVGEVLFDKLKIIDKAKKTKTGQYRCV